MYEVAVDKTYDDFCRLWLGRENVEKPHLDVFVIAKTTGNCKDNSQDRNNGQHR